MESFIYFNKMYCIDSIVFNAVDLINDCIIIQNKDVTGREESLDNWILCHQNDQQSQIIYRFPSLFKLKSGQTIRILSKTSPLTTHLESDTLVADKINTWGRGQTMITSLIDNNNEEKATIVQKYREQ